MVDEKKLNELLEKVAACKKGVIDLSCDEDLSVAVMNLISIEEHLFFTGTKTGNKHYFELLDIVREIRKELLARLVKNPAGEEWCISKHLLATTMRLIEVGTKQQVQGNREQAAQLFSRAYELYTLFWAINLKLITPEQAAVHAESATQTEAGETPPYKKSSTLEKLGETIKKIIDCCIE
jgi:hypothetical protein